MTTVAYYGGIPLINVFLLQTNNFCHVDIKLTSKCPKKPLNVAVKVISQLWWRQHNMRCQAADDPPRGVVDVEQNKLMFKTELGML